MKGESMEGTTKARIEVIREILDDPFIGRGLTPRETEISRLASRGLNQREISEELGISPETVKHHLTACRKKIREKPRLFPDLVFRQIEAVLRSEKP